MTRRSAPLAVLVLALVACKHPAAEVVIALPGAEPHPVELEHRLHAALAARGADYRPHTRHLRPDGSPRFTNRLILEASPYLLQHAHNPVDWYSWGDEAFAAARRLGRPVFLSIGYSTCHWCHVMEDESFEDEDIARTLNQQYVAIKVDREERPDVDASFMAAAEALGVDGGWPLNVWLTPDGKPFHITSYLPAHDGDRGIRQGLGSVLVAARNAFDQHRDDVDATGDQLVAALRARTQPAVGDAVADVSAMTRAAAFFAEYYDPGDGGLAMPGQRSKFPSQFPVRLLLRYARRSDDAELRAKVLATLDAMARGGIHDQIGGGFHRYATDMRWRVPHFEKMLSDNALLAMAYVEGYQASGRRDLLAVAERTLAFMDRELGSPDGGFYTALDADSPAPGGGHEEGRFYSWTPAEVAAVVGTSDAALVTAYLGISSAGNLEGGRSVPYLGRPLAELATSLGVEPAAAAGLVDRAISQLARARDQRPRPHRDDKVVTALNGLAISAFARAALATVDDAAVSAPLLAGAERAADFVLAHLSEGDRLHRSYAGGRATIDGYLDDYAFLIAGLLDLFEASGEARWLERAIALDRAMDDGFADPAGGYFLTRSDAATPLFRDKPMRDDAVPGGNSVAALDLLRLYQLTSKASYLARADKLFAAFAPALEREPMSLDQLLLALDFRTDRSTEVVLVADKLDELAPLLAVVATGFTPNRVLVRGTTASLAGLAGLVPGVDGKVPRAGKATAYVCEDQRCRMPTSEPDELARQLAVTAALPSVSSAATP